MQPRLASKLTILLTQPPKCWDYKKHATLIGIKYFGPKYLIVFFTFSLEGSTSKLLFGISNFPTSLLLHSRVPLLSKY
jgi:hypothetical protein